MWVLLSTSSSWWPVDGILLLFFWHAKSTHHTSSLCIYQSKTTTTHALAQRSSQLSIIAALLVLVHLLLRRPSTSATHSILPGPGRNTDSHGSTAYSSPQHQASIGEDTADSTSVPGYPDRKHTFTISFLPLLPAAPVLPFCHREISPTSYITRTILYLGGCCPPIRELLCFNPANLPSRPGRLSPLR